MQEEWNRSLSELEMLPKRKSSKETPEEFERWENQPLALKKSKNVIKSPSLERTKIDKKTLQELEAIRII